MLRFAVIKAMPEGGFSEVVPGYTEEQFLPRLKAKLNEKFLLKENYWKRRFRRKQCIGFLEKAFEECVNEVKEETVKLD